MHSLLKQLISVNKSRFYRSYYYQNLWTQGFLGFALWLWEYLPSKQGLRHFFLGDKRQIGRPLRVSSIKTRIKTSLVQANHQSFALWLWEYLPLKQGLRRIWGFNLIICIIALRVSSIRTRIKTQTKSPLEKIFVLSENIFH